MARSRKIRAQGREKAKRMVGLPVHTRTLVRATGYSESVQNFQACTYIGGGKRAGHMRGAECRYGSNPRKAIAASLGAVARGISRRSGAFAGLKRQR